MIEMTNLEFAIANYCVRPFNIFCGNGNWETRYGTNITETYGTREEAMEKTVLWLRKKHEEE